MTTGDAATALHVKRRVIIYQLHRLGVKKQGRDYFITPPTWAKLRQAVGRTRKPKK